MDLNVIDSHVHFWDPAELSYPWLDGLPALKRAFLPRDYRAAAGATPVAGVVFVEANCRPDQGPREVELVERLAGSARAVAGIVAFVDLTGKDAPRRLEALAGSPLVKGIRHNIQGQPAGFCLEPAFVSGVEQAGRLGFTFDLCATHDQLGEVGELVRRCPGTRFVLDHCGKPAIRRRLLEPWAGDVARLAACPNVVCKLSGLLTEAGNGWRDEDLAPYATHVLDCFGAERVLYGSDWPVLTLAGAYADWYGFTCRLTSAWSPAARRRFYHDTAASVYRL